jgi:hypothetical protein
MEEIIPIFLNIPLYLIGLSTCVTGPLLAFYDHFGLPVDDVGHKLH